MDATPAVTPAGFLSGVAVSLAAALVTSALTRHRERRRQLEESRTKIYMKLLELYGRYFWFASAEARHEAVKPETCREAGRLAFEISDLLRAAEGVEHLDEILDILFSPRWRTAAERYSAFGELLERLGVEIHPRFASKMREISASNLHALAEGSSSNAPGAGFFV